MDNTCIYILTFQPYVKHEVFALFFNFGLGYKFLTIFFGALEDFVVLLLHDFHDLCYFELEEVQILREAVYFDFVVVVPTAEKVALLRFEHDRIFLGVDDLFSVRKVLVKVPDGHLKVDEIVVSSKAVAASCLLIDFSIINKSNFPV